MNVTNTEVRKCAKWARNRPSNRPTLGGSDPILPRQATIMCAPSLISPSIVEMHARGGKCVTPSRPPVRLSVRGAR